MPPGYGGIERGPSAGGLIAWRGMKRQGRVAQRARIRSRSKSTERSLHGVPGDLRRGQKRL